MTANSHITKCSGSHVQVQLKGKDTIILKIGFYKMKHTTTTMYIWEDTTLTKRSANSAKRPFHSSLMPKLLKLSRVVVM